MPTLSAFADEVSQDPQLQMDILGANGIKHIELRGAYGLNVMKLSEPQCADLKTQFADRGFGVSCIASPIGKIRLDDDYRRHFDEFKHAVDLAEHLNCRYIRIFSYYAPAGLDIADHRAQVIDRLNEKVDYVANRNVTLVLENEKNLFGALPERCVYLFAAVRSKKLVAAFDPANFVNMNVPDVYNTCWIPLRSYVAYFHIKDFRYGEEERAVPAGKGGWLHPGHPERPPPRMATTGSSPWNRIWPRPSIRPGRPAPNSSKSPPTRSRRSARRSVGGFRPLLR